MKQAAYSTSFDEAALLRLSAAVRETGYCFITPTPSTHRLVNGRPGNEWARSLTDVFGWSRPFLPGETISSDMFALMQRAGVAERRGEGWRSLVRFSSLDQELFLHSAFPTDSAQSVFFGPDTYRFAHAVRSWLATRPVPVRHAVDIGCGAGPGGILVAKARPEADVVLVDINDAALGLARVNARAAAALNVRVCHSDLLSDVDGSFDLIIANPPYLVDPARRAYRHGGGEKGAGLSLAIVETASARLAPGGTLLLYTGAAIVNGRDAFRIAAENQLAVMDMDWSYCEVDPDVFGDELQQGAYSDADRIAAVVLIATKNQG